MKLTIDRVRDINVVRVAESRLMYPLLSDFSAAVVGLIGAGETESDRGPRSRRLYR